MSFGMASGSVTRTADKSLLLALVVVRHFLPSPVAAQSAKPVPSADWDRLVEAAKKDLLIGYFRGKDNTSFREPWGQATRRLDGDTKWLRETGVIPAKDHLSVKEFLQVENQSEEKLDKVHEPAQKFAATILK